MPVRNYSIQPFQTVLLDGQEGTWQTLSDIIARKLLPQVDAMGIAIFQHHSSPLPSDAQMVPFQDVWIRQKPYPERFPQLAYVVAGQGEMILGARWFVLPAGKGIIIPANIPHAPHAMRGGQIKIADWLRI
ncbi:MAG: cupin domain-containing protein, partial [Armatimonadetes bacterium]|nr:cupin domain-containing protein [Armatimonadota bacterium]